MQFTLPNLNRPSMPTVTLLIQIEESSLARIESTLQSLVLQTHQDWEVVFLMAHSDFHVKSLLERGVQKLGLEDECDYLSYDNDSSLPAINRHLSSMGDWVGFLTAGDYLYSNALEHLLESTEPEKLLTYSDSEHMSRWGHISYRNNKPPVNPHRLLFQNYLADPMLVRREWLEAHPFNERATDDPLHDVILRVLETCGAKAFNHVRSRCLRKHRDPFRVIDDPRELPYVSPYDLQAIKDALVRRNIDGVVQQTYGVAEIQYNNRSYPSMQVVCFLDEVTDVGTAVIKSLLEDHVYPSMMVRAVYRGVDPQTVNYYSQLCRSASIRFDHFMEAEPAILNRITRVTNQEAVLVLKALPLGLDWLRELGHLLTLGFCATTGRFIKLNRLTFPGTLGWKYEGVHWNHRGSFGELATPHQVSMMGSEAFLYDVREWFRVGAFDESLPTLYAADWTIRANTIGLKTPVHTSVSFITNAPVTSSHELQVLKNLWPDWKDPFELHSFV